MRKHVLALAAAVAALGTTAAAAPLHGHQLSWAPGVQWNFRLARAPEQYVAARRLEIRSDPEPDAIVTGILHRGEVFRAAGRTEDGWVAVMADGVVQGYVSEGVVGALGARPYARNDVTF